MSSFVESMILIGLMIVLAGLVWASPESKHTLRESFFRNTGRSYRNLVGLLLGYAASTLLLSGGVMTTTGAALWFVGTLTIIMLLLVLVRPYSGEDVDRFAWGFLVIIMLGFGVGTLIFHYAKWWKWLWHQYLRIKYPHDIILESLFLLGVILGVFVVRNWAKDQKAFMESLSGILGGTFVAAILGEVLKDENVGPKKAFAFYALGFTVSATINLIVAAVLTARYTNRRSITSRAVLDFLYGSERAEIIDKYFLKNFENDRDYAKRWLTASLLEFEKLAGREFGKRMEERRQARKKECKTSGAQGQSKSKPSCYYQLIAIESDESSEIPDKSPEKLEEAPEKLEESLRKPEGLLGRLGFKSAAKPEEPKYKVIYRQIEGTDDEDGPDGKAKKGQPAIDEKMFRVGIAAVWGETLEFVTAPGESRQPFKWGGSVAGLALTFRKTIVMHRDRHKRFRSPEFGEGITPQAVEQNRGLDAIDYLSYVSIPIVARRSEPTENPVGIMTIDTKLFVTSYSDELEGTPAEEAGEGVYRTRLTKSELIKFGANLYEQNDECVRLIEDLTKVITPVMELYAKCRIGSI